MIKFLSRTGLDEPKGKKALGARKSGGRLVGVVCDQAQIDPYRTLTPRFESPRVSWRPVGLS